MWHYVALSETKEARLFKVFSKLLWRYGTMWRYVALSKPKKRVFFYVFLESCCGAMALCGAMWRYLKPKETRFLCVFLNVTVALWHYVALCGVI